MVQKKLERTDRDVRIVLICLHEPRSRHQHQSLKEVMFEYNQKFPPEQTRVPGVAPHSAKSYLRKVVKLVKRPPQRMDPSTMQLILDFLVNEGLVKGEVFSLMHMEVLEEPTKFYTLTSAGMAELNNRR